MFSIGELLDPRWGSNPVEGSGDPRSGNRGNLYAFVDPGLKSGFYGVCGV
jgi:hypothetical protein